jgi:hypothetical protein
LLHRFFVEGGDLDHIMGLLTLPPIVEADAVNARPTGAVKDLSLQNFSALGLV